MAADPRRFDAITKVVSDQRRQLDDIASTVLSRLSSHTHFGASIPVVASTATITAPFTGQVIFNTTDNMLYRYDGSSWVAALAAGGTTTATQHEAAYTASGSQSIPTATDTPLAFATGNYTCADVTTGTSTVGSIANAKFTITRGGLWIIEGGVRIGNAVAGKSYGIWLGPDGGSTRYRAQFVDSGGTDAMEFSVAICSRFSSGTAFNLNFWHNEGVARSTQLLNGSNSIRFAWLRP